MLYGKTMTRAAIVAGLTLALHGAAVAGISPGVISDFNDGTEQGWSPPKNNTSNPGNFLEVLAAPKLAAFNNTPEVAGVIDPAVTAIQVDLLRPVGQGALDMRVVLMGPGTTNRWTSTNSQALPDDGIWHTFTFPILEAELTQVSGANSYADLTADLNRLMLRHQSGLPAAQGTSESGSFSMDNVVALPEPASVTLLGAGTIVLARRRAA